MTIEQEVSFQAGGNQLCGTLTLSDGVENPPVFLFLHGALPQTRDGDPDTSKRRWFPQPIPQRRLFSDEAQILAEAGIASLRYDKRGCGQSEGDCNTTRLLDLVEDARAAIHWLSSVDGLDMNRFGLLGHNEGALIASILAADNPAVRYLVLQSARYTELAQVVRKQAAMLWQYPEVVVDSIRQYNPFFYWLNKDHEQVLASIERGDEFYRLGDEQWSLDVYLPWLRDHAEHAPSKYLGRIKCPVLILHSRLEDRISFTDAIQMAQALEQAGNTDVTVEIFDDVDSDFRQLDFQSLDNLDMVSHLKKPLAPEFCQALSRWLQSVI